MKIKLIGTFNKEQFDLACEFIETQHTTDRERKTTSISMDDLDIVVKIDRYEEIESITIRSEEQ